MCIAEAIHQGIGRAGGRNFGPRQGFEIKIPIELEASVDLGDLVGTVIVMGTKCCKGDGKTLEDSLNKFDSLASGSRNENSVH